MLKGDIRSAVEATLRNTLADIPLKNTGAIMSLYVLVSDYRSRSRAVENIRGETYVIICIKNGGLYKIFWLDQYRPTHPMISTTYPLATVLIFRRTDSKTYEQRRQQW